MNTAALTQLFDGQTTSRVQVLLITTLALIAIGFVAMSSASVEYAALKSGTPLFHVLRYCFHLVLALLFAGAVFLVPMAVWQRTTWLWLLAGFVLLALVLIPGIGREVNGSRRWLVLGPLTLQCSEFVKLFMILYLAGYLVRRQKEVRSQWSGFIKPMAVLFVVTLLLMLEPDFGATVVTVATAFGMIFLGGVKLGQFVLVILSSVAAFTLLLISEPYRMQRLVAFTDPWADQYNSGYQLTQSLIAFGRGEWFGVGLGNSIQKLFYLPEAHTDFVFAIWAEEFGFFGVVVVLALFVTLVGTILAIGRAAEQQGKIFNAYVAYGVSFLLSLQIFINIGVNTGLLPTKGLTLPFLSYGGSSLMVCCGLIALVLRIALDQRQGASDE